MSTDMIEKDKVISVHIELRDEVGELLDSSHETGEPLVYMHGAGHIVPGLEKALEGKGVGDKFELTLVPADAFGERSDAEMVGIPREEFGDDFVPEEGMPLGVDTDEGFITVWVDRADDDTVYLDPNHPLAGQTLTFKVEVLEIRDPTAEELEHGHPHFDDDDDCGCGCDCE